MAVEMVDHSPERMAGLVQPFVIPAVARVGQRDQFDVLVELHELVGQRDRVAEQHDVIAHAVDDHQTSNARFLSDAGAAILMPQAELSVDALAKLPSLGRDQLREMAEKARALARPEAARDVANVCEELVK